MRRVVLVIALALLAAPAAARAEEYTAQAGAVSAKLTWTPPAQERGAPVFALTVERAGAVRVDRPLQVKNCAGRYFKPSARYEGDAPLRVLDLDRDGEPEVVVFAYRGGAHCCFLAYVLHHDVTRAFPRRVRQDARRLWRAYRSALRHHGEQLGLLAGWAADRYRLGHRHTALRRLHRERLRGHLHAGRGVLSGRRYVRKLDEQLRKLGYLRRR